MVSEERPDPARVAWTGGTPAGAPLPADEGQPGTGTDDAPDTTEATAA